MWLFTPEIAALRSMVQFAMRITTHSNAQISGRRVAYTVKTSNPIILPFAPTQCAEVEVEYTHEHKTVRETLPVNHLIAIDAHAGCPHVVFRPCSLPIGTMVDITKKMRTDVRIVRLGEERRKQKNQVVIPASCICPTKKPEESIST